MHKKQKVVFALTKSAFPGGGRQINWVRTYQFDYCLYNLTY